MSFKQRILDEFLKTSRAEISKKEFDMSLK